MTTTLNPNQAFAGMERTITWLARMLINANDNQYWREIFPYSETTRQSYTEFEGSDHTYHNVNNRYVSVWW